MAPKCLINCLFATVIAAEKARAQGQLQSKAGARKAHNRVRAQKSAG